MLRAEPAERGLGGDDVFARDRLEPGGDEVGIDQVGVKNCGDQVSVLLAEGDKFGHAEASLVQPQASELRLAGGGSGVGVLHPDPSIASALAEYLGVEVDAVDAEAVDLLEG